MSKNKILIVGAGPAGVSSALFLAKKGIASTLIDKESFPRDKICGDGLTAWVITNLHKLDMGLVEEIRDSKHAYTWSSVKIIAPNYKTLLIKNFYKNRPGEAPGFTIRRKELDTILINKVKENELIDLHEGVEVTGMEETDRGVRLLTNIPDLTFEGDIVVWCDGAKSKFSIKEGGMPAEHQSWLTAIKTYYSGLFPEYTDETRKDYPNNSVELYCLKDIMPGYFWIFPLANGEANVGLGTRTDILKKNRINLKQTMEKIINETPVLKERFRNAKQIAPVEAWPIPIGMRKRPLSGNRFIIAGDAASLSDPASGEGVGNSLNSGFHVGEHIADCLAENRFDAVFNKKYDQRIYNRLWHEFRASKIAQWFIKHPVIFTWVIGKFIKNEKLIHDIIEISNDQKGYTWLKRQWIYLKLIFG